MPVIMGQFAVPGSATVPAFLLPTGLANFCVFQPSSGAPVPVYLGNSASVSSSNGAMVPITPFNSESYNSTGGGKLFWATTGSSTASSFSFIISTAA